MSFQPYYYSYSARKPRKKKAAVAVALIAAAFTCTLLISVISNIFAFNILSPFSGNSLQSLSEEQTKHTHEVFGFAPHWTINKLENVDFNVLTTLAYFGIEVDDEGNMEKTAPGYKVFYSDKSTALFKKAHSNGTRVVLTLTQMKNDKIKALLNNPEGQKRIINDSTNAVVARGIDGINVDFEYVGDPGPEYRRKFSVFVKNMTDEMHRKLPGSRVTVSVYASAVKYPKIYDIASLGRDSDGIFMMAYDFATAGSSQVIPTAPLYGHKEGKYWYDIATAVDDFLTLMPKEKLILGLPWYGYNYPVAEPGIKVSKDTGYYSYYWKRGRRYSTFISRPAARAQTYTLAANNTSEVQGWDDLGKVGWRAYKDETGLWRMIFLDDVKSLSVKYDFAKEKGLGGVGMWALGFDNGKTELWQLLSSKFGKKYVDKRIIARQIYEI